MKTEITRCGYVALIGRPNVGKSTLLNALVGQPVSIISHKKQTTRHVIHGIKTQGLVQTVYVDTPGIHTRSTRALNRYMNRAARSAMAGVDVVVFIVSVEHWNQDDELVLSQIKEAACPVILAVNKIDILKGKEELLVQLEKLSQKMQFAEIVPLSAKKGENVERLESVIQKYLPESPHFFEADQVTNRDEAFLFSEIIREQLFKQAHQEIPYSATVGVEKIEREDNLTKIYATIYVEKSGQKAIVIGEKGQKLKQIGQRARLRIEKLLGNKVFLQLWVKVKPQWADDERSLRSLGFD